MIIVTLEAYIYRVQTLRPTFPAQHLEYYDINMCVRERERERGAQIIPSNNVFKNITYGDLAVSGFRK